MKENTAKRDRASCDWQCGGLSRLSCSPTLAKTQVSDDWQPKFQNNLEMVSVFLYERSRMVYLRIWINTVKIAEMLNASVLWMKTCVCLMALFSNICVGSRKREQLCDRMGVSLLFLLSLFPTPYSITKQYRLYCLCWFTSGSASDLGVSMCQRVPDASTAMQDTHICILL